MNVRGGVCARESLSARGVRMQVSGKGVARAHRCMCHGWDLCRRGVCWVAVEAQCALFPSLSPVPPAAMEISNSLMERTIAENSLVILLQGLRGRVTTVELRDESAAAGLVTNVDAFMNVRLAEVTLTDRHGAVTRLDQLFVAGRNVRYVHIPDDVDIRATIEEQLQAINRVRFFGSRNMGRREFPRAKDKRGGRARMDSQ
ncbi:U7 snRNA-associated Sm-like protein LSm10 [Empidonax traillii]|uniref:U7 snRNA-associated Sm-like protein LSm10 n=1 Tax=Empidonax traillii TaxID=164674 RepID=UPI000FFD698C|nr:U7 snRNA-associated Sm-like protein LSm10 [Empidonax traillii]